MSSQLPTSVGQPKVSYVIDPRGPGKTTRVLDCLAQCPKSRDFQDIEDVDFDAEFRSAPRFNKKANLHPKMLSHLKEYIDAETMKRIDMHIPFLLDTAANRILTHSYDTHGLDDVRDMLYCEVNVSMALLCMVHDVPLRDMWRVSLRDMPSRGGSVEITYTSRLGRQISLRAVSENDRKGVTVGPSIPIMTPEGVMREALIDLSSYSKCCEELIVIGSDERFEFEIGHMTYTKYNHVDSPLSKTATPHYRLYNIWGTVDMGDMILNYPVLVARMVRAVTPGNVLESLPYPGDLLRLIELRPDLTAFLCGVVRMICNGDIIRFSSGHGLRTLVHSKGVFTIKHVFIDGLYIKNQFTEMNHGKGYQWNKIYNEMFN